MAGHLAQQVQVWEAVGLLASAGLPVELDGQSLSIAQLVATSRHHVPFAPSQSSPVLERTSQSINTRSTYLAHNVVYGLNTAPGGNAYLRTAELETLQHSFLQHHQTGILPKIDELSSNDETISHSLPEAVVRASAVIRCNSLLRGHSGVRIEVIQSLAGLISSGLTPVIPLRGSISASGDLCPLSYFGGVLEGNRDIYVRKRRTSGCEQILSAEEALRQHHTKPVSLEPKEGLAVLNGTSVSTAYAALVMQDCHDLAILCQLLTALAVEALNGKASNYHQFFSDVRPHPGQAEVAQNIRSFLIGTKLTSDEDSPFRLAQDRYAIRTAPQWIGPQLEDLMAAQSQISVELNSTTDNPLVDIAADCLRQGGNFQASSVTSAMEKSRTAITMLGRIVLAQAGELVNPDLNCGLPPNLCADDPTVSFTCKGVDINMTAYFSELAFMANSVVSHVQTAEINNQSVNSLALISARMTAKATEILAMMTAAHLYMLCQAVDLRCREQGFLAEAYGLVRLEFEAVFSPNLVKKDMEDSFSTLWPSIMTSWLANNHIDVKGRCKAVSDAAAISMLEGFQTNENRADVTLEQLTEWQTRLASCLSSTFDTAHRNFCSSQTTPSYLAKHTGTLYSFVRTYLGIPFHEGVKDHPPIYAKGERAGTRSTIGSHITQIFEAIRDKSILQALHLSDISS